MSWHARQKAQHRAVVYRRAALEALDETELIPDPIEPKRIIRARVFKADGIWHFQRGTLTVPCASWDEAVDYLLTFGQMMEQAA